jgi:hypothetical protein
MIEKCEYCDSRNLMTYKKSCNIFKYYRLCVDCGRSNYKEFPYHIPQEQHNKYMRSLNEIS